MRPIQSFEVITMIFRGISAFVLRHPWRVIAAWIVAAVVLGSFAPPLKTSGDQASFLPSSYEYVRAQHAAERAFPQHAGATGVVVVQRDDRGVLTVADRQRVAGFTHALARHRPPGVSAVSGAATALSQDGRVALIGVGFAPHAGDDRVVAGVKDVRARAGRALHAAGMTARVGGAAGQTADIKQAGKDAEGTVMLVTGALILILLAVIFRSIVTALLPLVTIVVVSMVAMAGIGIASSTLGLNADADVGALLTVVLFGIGTDYIVFLLFRMRERLRAGDEPRTAVDVAVRRVGPAIASSAAVVIAAFAALVASQLSSNRALAPSLVIAVAVMLLAALTLVPAVLALAGPRIFWPSKHWRDGRESRLAAGAARRIAFRPRAVVIATAAALVVMAAGSLAYHPSYDASGNLSAKAESLVAQETLKHAFPRLSADPTTVYLVKPHGAAATARLAHELRAVPGVAGVSAPVTGRGDVTRLDVSLTETSQTANAALDLVEHRIRPVAHASGAADQVLVGGTTAAYADVRHAIDRDYRVVLPLAALAIMAIVAVLLRSLVAPAVLLGAVVLGFLATLGLTVGVFEGLAGHGGVDFSLPLTMYAFVVAIGTDYNILMASRLREEDGTDFASTVQRAVRATLPTMAAAGLILAGTFASLMLTPGSSNHQLGFAVAAGILVSAFPMAGTLVPALARLLGHRLWWPSRAPAEPRHVPAEPDAAAPRHARPVSTV